MYIAKPEFSIDGALSKNKQAGEMLPILNCICKGVIKIVTAIFQ
jgi:hypothetical protein